MKHFILQVLFLLIIPTTIILGCFEWKLRTIPNDYKYKDEWMRERSSNVEVLNLGSSHGYFGIQPKCFSRTAFNLAFTSQDLRYDKFLYDKYVSKCDSLLYLILPISYFSFRSDLESGIESWRIKSYCIYMNCNYHWYNPYHNLEITSTDKLQSFKDIICDEISFINCDTLGWGTNYTKQKRNEDWQLTGNIAADRHTTISKEFFEDNLSYLLSIVEDCKKRGVKVILLTTPTYCTYYNNLDTEQLSEMDDICNQIDRNNEHVVYLNWLKHGEFTEDDFFDADHLNEYGAEKLTKMINKYILQMEKYKKY